MVILSQAVECDNLIKEESSAFTSSERACDIKHLIEMRGASRPGYAARLALDRPFAQSEARQVVLCSDIWKMLDLKPGFVGELVIPCSVHEDDFESLLEGEGRILVKGNVVAVDANQDVSVIPMRNPLQLDSDDLSQWIHVPAGSDLSRKIEFQKAVIELEEDIPCSRAMRERVAA